MGGKFHVKVNTSLRPLANKYLEGKMKRTLKRESKEFEFAEWKASKKPVSGKAVVFRRWLCLQSQLVCRRNYNGAFASAVNINVRL